MQSAAVCTTSIRLIHASDMVSEVILRPRRQFWLDSPVQTIQRRGVRTKHRHHRHLTPSPRVVVHGTILGTLAVAILQHLAAGDNVGFFHPESYFPETTAKAFRAFSSLDVPDETGNS
ncbi:hypothetical protein Z517_04811 [Fonsecaea pedrosoi CBS 271.37]|uniref:Uncharacterized protein n=1 Tax=Fonsecaea pedrosoi CBS 271.37 TaxID=1442368 RepID=A0A0D2GT91_9EURO|nr:uncharacterized protein Z517_04811 [Fonsecaea pedrosoi CBS 271.37]KIW81785.1 hypothetical protein Z517_04811 [Fonsecaea pedrosoi CBS 271.37]